MNQDRDRFCREERFDICFGLVEFDKLVEEEHRRDPLKYWSMRSKAGVC